jgi:hypothetical protein
MQIPIPSGGLSVNSSAGLLFGVVDDPAVKKAENNVKTLRKKHQEVCSDRELPYDQLVSRYQTLYKNSRAEKAVSHIKTAKILGIGAGLGSAAAICVAGLGLAASIGLGICSLPFSFYCVPQLYAQIASRLVIPRQVDGAVREVLGKEADRLSEELGKAEDTLNTLVAPYLREESEEQKDKAVEVDASQEYVIIDGIRLPRKAEPPESMQLRFIPGCLRKALQGKSA